MAITFQSINNASTNSGVTTLSVNVPAGAVNDLLLLCAVNGAPVAYNALTGWTPVDALASTKNGSTAAGIWYRYADGTEAASYSPAWATTTNSCVAGIVRYSGVSKNVLPTAANRHGFAQFPTGSANTSATSPVPSTLSGVTSGDLIVNLYCYGQRIRSGGQNDAAQVAGLPSWNAAPAGWIQRGTTMTSAGGATFWNCGYLICDKFDAADHPTASTTSSPTDQGSHWMVESIALAAAPTPPRLQTPLVPRLRSFNY